MNWDAGPRPTVDILISTYNEERYIARCLEQATGQRYPENLISIWVVDGGSDDSTVTIARAHATVDPRVHVLADGRRRNLPEALNLALERSSAELVAKVDAHGSPDRDFIAAAVDAMLDGGESVACVGGQPEQHGETPFGRAVALSRTARFGSGRGSYTLGRQARPVPSVQCGVYRRSVLEQVGPFDPDMAYGEDEELNFRITEAGFRILLDPRVRFHYFTRPTWRGAYRQYRNYGTARIRVVRAHPGFLRPHHLAPGVLVVVLAGLAGPAVVQPAPRRALLAIVAGYLAAATAGAGLAARSERRLIPRVIAAFGALHLGYGVGVLRGLSDAMRKRRHTA
jgi:succinoglycan biosynthesis protein ExoA